MRRGDRFELRIDRLSVGGRGIGLRSDGLVVFVPFSVTGDFLLVELTIEKKNFAEARIVRIIEGSSERMTPPCPVAGRCGGCSWQQMTYAEQLRQKQKLVLDSLQKFSGFTSDEIHLDDVVPSSRPFRYRNRIQLHYGNGKLGFFARGSHQIVDIDDCLIADERLTEGLPSLKQRLAAEKPGRMELFLTSEDTVESKMKFTESPLTKVDEESIGSSFAQVNSVQNENLIAAVLEYLMPTASCALGHGRLIELYAGSGNFTFPIAERWPNLAILAVELAPLAAAKAQTRAQALNRTGSFEFRCADVGQFLALVQIQPNDVVLLDPPRAGCGPEVMRSIAEARPKRVIYVSCHPVTLARDLGILRLNGFRLLNVKPFDMFPQTDHVESLAVLDASHVDTNG